MGGLVSPTLPVWGAGHDPWLGPSLPSPCPSSQTPHWPCVWPIAPPSSRSLVQAPGFSSSKFQAMILPIQGDPVWLPMTHAPTPRPLSCWPTRSRLCQSSILCHPLPLARDVAHVPGSVVVLVVFTNFGVHRCNYFIFGLRPFHSQVGAST